MTGVKWETRNQSCKKDNLHTCELQILQCPLFGPMQFLPPFLGLFVKNIDRLLPVSIINDCQIKDVLMVFFFKI